MYNKETKRQSISQQHRTVHFKTPMLSVVIYKYVLNKTIMFLSMWKWNGQPVLTVSCITVTVITFCPSSSRSPVLADTIIPSVWCPETRRCD